MSHVASKDDDVGEEVLGSIDAFVRLGHSELLPPLDIQNADQQSVDLIGNWQDGGEETGGLPESDSGRR